MKGALLIFVALASVVFAQQGGSTETPADGVGSIVTGSAGPLAGTNPNLAHRPGSTAARLIFLAGNVQFDDGTTPNNQIRIERVCNAGGARVETHTDAKGHFSFQVGGEQGNNASDADYSSSTFGGSSNGLSRAANGDIPSLMGCELRAAYPGYVSDTVDVSQHHALDDSSVGTLVLHRMANVQGSTVSSTTAEAPKSAQKNYEKGVQALQKSKVEEASRHFYAATSEFPKYAEAWVALGETDERLNKLEEAKKAFLSAAAADSRYVSPYDMLARLYVVQKDWSNAAKYSKQAIELNPLEFPSSFWYNAMANFNLKNMPEAEKSALALVKIDTHHHYPGAETMLAEFAAHRGDLEAAASHLKAYLAEAPNSKDADLMKRQLARVEAALTPQKSQQQQ